METNTLNDWLNKLIKIESPWQILKIDYQEKFFKSINTNKKV